MARNRFKRRRLQTYIYLILVLFVFSMGIGYAALSETLTLEGTTDIDEASWNVHFQNVQITSGSVTATTEPTISDNTSISFGVNLEDPGDFYEFTVDVVNDGSLDAKLNAITVLPELTSEESNFFRYQVQYLDGVPISEGNALAVGATETIIVRFEYLVQADVTLYPTEDTNFSFSVSMNYVQGKGVGPRIYDVGNVVFTVGNEIPTDGVYFATPTEAITAFGHNFLLKHTMNGSHIYGSYVGILVGSDMIYIQGNGATYNETLGDYNGDSIYYDNNKNILINALGSSACSVEAHANYEGFNCTYGTLSIGINQKGYATVREGTNKCSVYGDGTSVCQ